MLWFQRETHGYVDNMWKVCLPWGLSLGGKTASKCFKFNKQQWSSCEAVVPMITTYYISFHCDFQQSIKRKKIYKIA